MFVTSEQLFILPASRRIYLCFQPNHPDTALAHQWPITYFAIKAPKGLPRGLVQLSICVGFATQKLLILFERTSAPNRQRKIMPLFSAERRIYLD